MATGRRIKRLMSPQDREKRRDELWEVVLCHPQPFTAVELDKLRNDIPSLSDHSERTQGIVHARINIELLDAIRRFDEGSTKLVNTTNALTVKILRLTWVSLVISVVSLIVAGIAPNK
jgi:hypothetical protein